MDRFELAEMLRVAKPVNRETFICEKCRGKRVLDLGCIRHSAEFALNDPGWLHKLIKQAAKSVVGVDYLPEEVAKMAGHGYDIVMGDVTKPMNLTGQFDVIVAGDLLEHLTNFDGFFTNCEKFLAPGGVLIITTPNPFFAGEYGYVSMKMNFLVNPEHTCWIDPLCLLQLVKRFGFRIEEASFVSQSWKLGDLICENRGNEYDILNAVWLNDSFFNKFKRVLIGKVFNVLFAIYGLFIGAYSPLVRRSDYLAVLKKNH